MIRDFILEQPAVIERVLARFPQALERLPGVIAPRAVWLIGSGTSKNALYAVAPTFERLLGVPVRVEGPMAFLKTAPDGGGSLAVVVSQTGTSTTSVAAVERAQASGFRTLAVTAESGSRFAATAQQPLLMPMGPEPVGPKTKGYIASIACLLVLAYRLAGCAMISPFDRARAEKWVALGERAVAQLVSPDLDHVMVLAQRAHQATALEGALKVSEMSGIAASAFDTEESLHGRFHGLGGKSLALFVAADEAEVETAVDACRGLAGLGVKGRILDLTGAAPREYRVELPAPGFGELDIAFAVVPFQWFAVALAGMKGLRPEDMRYPDMSQRFHTKIPGGPP